MTKVERINLEINNSTVTVESFSASLGWNSSPTTLNVTTLEDPDPGSSPASDGQTFAADDYSDDGLENQIKAGSGGTEFLDGNPGSLITVSAGTFNFTGMITSWRRTNSQSGRKIEIQAQDPRVLLSKIPVVLSSDIYSHYNLNVGHPGSTFNPELHNIVDILGQDGDAKRYGHPLNSANNKDGADFTREGIQFRKLPFFFGTKVFSMMGKSFFLDFNIATPARNLLYHVPLNYRVPITTATLSSLLDKAAQDNNFDWYVEVDPSAVAVDFKMIIKVVPRTENPNVFAGANENQITKFLTAQKDQDKIISFDVGRELRTDAQDVMILGDNRRTVFVANENPNGTRLASPIFGAFKDGRVLDRMIVPLDTIQGANTNLVNNLPTVSTEQGSLITTPGNSNLEDDLGNLFTPYPNYKKSRAFTAGKKGYAVTAEILRAALYSKESWATLVWYYYYDLGLAGKSYKAFDGYDDGVSGLRPIARLPGNLITTLTAGVPESMGIYSPAFDRGNPENPFKARMGVPSLFSGNAGLGDEFKEQKLAIQEACYKATVKYAEEYYGKKFIVSLPHSTLWDGYFANPNVPGYQDAIYNANDRDIVNDYDIADGGPPFTNTDHGPNNRIGFLADTPEINSRENDSFVTNKGLYKPMMQFNHDAVFGWQHPHYTSVDYSEFSSDKSAKIGGVGAGFQFLTSDVSIKRYRFDPRFAIATLSSPIKLGYGHIRGIVATYNTSGNNAGDLASWETTLEPATNVSRKDTSGAFQAFASHIYKDFTLIENLTKVVNGVTIRTKVLDDGTNKLIDAKFYDRIMYAQAKEKSDTFGLDQIRYVGVAQDKSVTGVPVSPDLVGATVGDYDGFLAYQAMTFYIPIKWNYYHYGPFSNSGISFAPASFLQNKNLNPWNYGSTSAMDRAGKILADNAASNVSTLAYLNVEVEGYPEFNFGYNPNDDDDESSAVTSTLSDLRISQGMNGVKTNYAFRTYFGQTSKRKREEVDQVRFSETSKDEMKKDIIKLDDIMKDLDIEPGNKFENPFNAGSVNRSGTGGGSSTDAIKSVPATNDSQPSTTMGSQAEIADHVESRQDLAGTYIEEHHAAINEIFVPISTDYPEGVDGQVSSANGIVLDGSAGVDKGEDGQDGKMEGLKPGEIK